MVLQGSMEERSKFMVCMSSETLASIGANTPTHLDSSMHQMAFRGVITDHCLKGLLKKHDPLILVAIKMILRKGFLRNVESFRVDTTITSRFLVVLLDICMAKKDVTTLLKRIFFVDYLGRLEEVLLIAIFGTRVLQPKDMAQFYVPGEVVKYYPFILDLKGMALVEHKKISTVGIDYL